MAVESRARALARAFGALGVALLASACSVLATFDTLVPKDAGSTRVARAVPYGEGPRRMLDIYAPAGAHASALPVIVFFYGGSWATGDRRYYSFVGRALAARGFVTVIPDYRLVPEVTYPGFVEDGAAAVNWTASHIGDYGGDPRRIVLAGHSAGAYIAAMLSVDKQWLGEGHKAVRGLVGLAGPYDFAPFTLETTRQAFGSAPDAAATQPVNLAAPGDPPALLAYGDADHIVLPRNSIRLAERLRGVGVPVRVRAYAGMGHTGIVRALALPFRREAPVLDDIAQFAHQVTRTDK